MRYFYCVLIIITIGCLLWFSKCYNRASEFKESSTWVKLHEKEALNSYYMRNNKIYGICHADTEFYSYFSPLEGIDLTTFVVSSDSEYAKDKNRVYYPIRWRCVDGEDFGGSIFAEYVVEGADPGTFKNIGGGYGVDRLNMYYQGKKIKWNQPLLENPSQYIMEDSILYYDLLDEYE